VDSPAPEAGRPDFIQDSSALKARQSLQHESNVADSMAFEAGWSAATQRAPNSSEKGIIEEFRDLDKLG
jgi:hypothetical protein